LFETARTPPAWRKTGDAVWRRSCGFNDEKATGKINVDLTQVKKGGPNSRRYFQL
jgi:hypothetical protein